MKTTTASQPSNGMMDVATALDDAIAQLQAGVPLEQCLAAQPTLAADLRPLLELAACTMQVAPAAPPPGAKARVRAAVLAAAEAHLARRPWWELGWLRGWRMRPAGFAAAGAAALFALGGGGAVVASANALPGEPLYAVKLATEDARLAVAAATGKPEAQAHIHVEIADRRIAEAQSLADQGRPVPPGLIESALRQVDAADKKVGQLPEPQRAQAAAKIKAAHDQHVERLTQLEQRVPPPQQAAIQRAMEAEQAKHAGHKEDERTTVALPPGVANGARGGAGAAAATSRPSSAARAREDERKDDQNGAKDEHPEDRPGEGNGRDQSRGRPARAGESGSAQPGLRDAALAVATAVGAANAGGLDQNRGNPGSPGNQGNSAGPPPALPRQAPPDDNQRDDDLRGNQDRGRSSGAPDAQPAMPATPATPSVTPTPHAGTNAGTTPAANARPGEPRDDHGRDADERDDRGATSPSNAGGGSGGSGGSGGAGTGGRR